MEQDVLILGGGPAGLAAAALLGESGLRVSVVDRQSPGGELLRVEWIAGDPPQGRENGAALAARLIARAEAAGVRFVQGDVTEIETYSGCVVLLLGGQTPLAAPALILAGGRSKRPSGIEGLPDAQDGLIGCAMCDAVFYREQTVAVCGAGEGGALDALHLARYASCVYLVEQSPQLQCDAELRARIAAEPNIQVVLGERLFRVDARAKVRRIFLREQSSGRTRELEVTGLAVQAGRMPSTKWLHGVVALNEAGEVVVDAELRTSRAAILAIGDIRAGSDHRVASALRDAGRAAATMAAMLSPAAGTI